MTEPTRSFPFMASSPAISVPATDQASLVTLPALLPGASSLLIVNSWPVMMWITGTLVNTADRYAAEGSGLPIPPFFWGVISTKGPYKFSAIAVDRPQWPLRKTDGTLQYPNAALTILFGAGE